MDKKINFIKSLSLLIGLTTTVGLHAEETIEYYAEHLLEVPLDARYLSTPLTPASTSNKHLQLQLGYSSFSAGKMKYR